MSETKQPTSNPTPPIEDNADKTEIEVKDSDIHVDVFRSSGSDEQSANATNSPLRITHLPTGIIVSADNKEVAMKVLKARLLDLKRYKQE